MKATVLVHVAVLFAVLSLVVAIAASGSRAQPLPTATSDAFKHCVGWHGEVVLETRERCRPVGGIVVAQTEFEAAGNLAGYSVGGQNAVVGAGRDNLIEGIAPAPTFDLMLDVPGPTARVEFGGAIPTRESALAAREMLFDGPMEISSQEIVGWAGRDDTTLVNIMELQISGEWFGWQPQRPGTERIFDR